MRFFWQKYNQKFLAILYHQSDICTTEKERQVHIMKNEIRFTLEPKQDQSWHGRLEIYLEQHRIMSGCQAVHTILQDTDWTKRAYCITRMEQKKK